MNQSIRHDLTALVRRWDADVMAMRDERLKWPMNHVFFRIYSGMINQQNADMRDVISIMQRHDAPDQTEAKLSDALVEIERLRTKLKSHAT